MSARPLCDECGKHPALKNCPRCFVCEYREIKSLPGNALFSPKNGQDVVELFFARHGHD